MNTPSHFLMTAALEKSLPKVAIVKSAFLLGSVAPDLPLWILSLGGIIYYHLLKGWSLEDTSSYLFGELFFQNPFWMSSHNFLHSLVILLLGLSLVWYLRRRNSGLPTGWFLWFLLACLLHSVIDILTHVDDGPLLFFPLEWTIRFQSPVSYWDHRYYGKEFSIFELVLNVVLLIYLISPWIYRHLCKLIRSYTSNS
ncbi:MAG: hypothetical protein F6K47_21920 [Symploca sp. SIO2E6]|nr:hypothetical protein [Symploca sp. SIO2E6]